MAKIITISQKTCKKCGHRWLPRSADEPLICPKCKTARWKIGRFHQGAAPRRENQAPEATQGEAAAFLSLTNELMPTVKAGTLAAPGTIGATELLDGVREEREDETDATNEQAQRRAA
jgi:uncharacterized Zn finger protein (UPF0148 family)